MWWVNQLENQENKSSRILIKQNQRKNTKNEFLNQKSNVLYTLLTIQ
jgi:hypothetical protein